MILSSLDWNALLARVFTGWVLRSEMVKSHLVETIVNKGQASDCADHNIQTIAAGPSQCLIMDILNDLIQCGLECFAGKGLHRLGIEIRDGKISSCTCSN